MEPRFPHLGTGEDPLVTRARDRADGFRYQKARFDMGTAKYVVLGIALIAFAGFLGAIWWCMDRLETVFKPGEWFGVY